MDLPPGSDPRSWLDWSEARFAPGVPRFGEPVPGWPLLLRPGAYAVIADPAGSGSIAVADTGQGLYLPGGGREEAEDPLATLNREALEELAMRIAPLAPIGAAIQVVHSIPRRKSVEKRGLFFHAACLGYTAGRTPEHALLWLPPAAAIDRLAHHSHRWAVERWLAR
jgi:8-oxo-dGTP pyrophosphatase MutT (NUDIX family)